MAKVTLGGQVYDLVPTAGAMRQIEQLGELTLAEMFQAHVAGRLKLEEISAIVYAGMSAAATANEVSYAAVMERVFELRVTDPALRRSVGEYLAELLYHPSDAKNREAAMHILDHGGHGSDPAT